MNRARTSVSISVLTLFACIGPAIAGPLNPPAGAVGTSMKTLTEVEPRTVINATNTPGDSDSLFKITASGSYYLTGNLQGVAGKSGIEVAASNVTIDLNGFAVMGSTGQFSGVVVGGANAKGVVVKNGSVSGWGASGVILGEAGIVEKVRVSGNLLSGIWVGSHGQVLGCESFDNGSVGISTGAGCVVRSCTASGNTALGIGVYGGSVAEGCVASHNTGDGFQVGNHCQVKACSGFDNAGSGFACSDSSQVLDCTASNNTLDGIDASYGVRITNCTAFSNTRHGISVGSQCAVIGNLCRLNGSGAGQGAGVYVTSGSSRTVVEGNTCVANDNGVEVESASNLVKGNTCSSNSVNFEIAAGNRVAIILTLSTSGAISGNTGGVSVSDPDANYAY